jgi:hypothetical protein
MPLHPDVGRRRRFVRYSAGVLLGVVGSAWIVTTGLWVRSYWRAEAVAYTAPRWLFGAGLENGSFDVLFSSFPSGSGSHWTGALGFQHRTVQAVRGARWIPYPRKFDILGLSFGSGTMPIPSAPPSWIRPLYWVISIPPWYVDLILAIPLICLGIIRLFRT